MVLEALGHGLLGVALHDGVHHQGVARIRSAALGDAHRLAEARAGVTEHLERLLTHFWMSRDIFSSSDLRVSGGVFIHSSITDGGIM